MSHDENASHSTKIAWQICRKIYNRNFVTNCFPIPYKRVYMYVLTIWTWKNPISDVHVNFITIKETAN